MNTKWSWCSNCGGFKPIFTLEKPVRIVVKRENVSYTYNEVSAYCSDCHKELYVPEINDENVDRRMQAYEEVK